MLRLDLDSLYAQWCQALSDEISAQKADGGQRYRLHGGRLVGRKLGDFQYRFETEGELTVPDGSQVRVAVEGLETVAGELVSARGFEAIVSLAGYLGDSIAPADLVTEPWFLLEALIDRLTELFRDGRGNLPLVAELIGPAQVMGPAEHLVSLEEPVAAGASTALLNRHQAEAVRQCCERRVSFVWGPPGTGKTRTLGAAAAEFIRRGERCLIVAPSNVAVDQAAKSVVQAARGEGLLQPGTVVRFGPPVTQRDEDLNSVTVGGILEQTRPDLGQRAKELEARGAALHQMARTLAQKRPAQAAADAPLDDATRCLQEEFARASAELAAARAAFREERSAAETALLQGARVIACTLAKAAVSAAALGAAFDVTVVDEASMAQIPAIGFVTALAQARVAIFGDFRQLAPVAVGETEPVRQWLGRDVFQVAGIIEAVDAGRGDPRLSMLREQHRMAPPICRIVNELVYGGLLIDAESVADHGASCAAVGPLLGKAVAVVDTHSLRPYCYKEKGSRGSRFSPYSAAVCAALAKDALHGLAADSAGRVSDRLPVAVITPYAAQARLLRAMLADLGIGDRVRASTVHRFQGSEAEVVIFDFVEGNPERIGLMLNDMEGDATLRLLNVAFTRARGKLVLVADVPHLNGYGIPGDTLKALQAFLQQHHSPNVDLYDASVLPPCDLALWPDNHGAAIDGLSDDVRGAEQEIQVSCVRSSDPGRHLPLDLMQQCREERNSR